MANSTYESQDTWKTIEQFLPSRLHLKDGQQPIEEWWENRGHQIHLDRWRNTKASLRVIMHHGVGTNGHQMSMILGVPLFKAGFEVVAIDMPGYGCTKVNKTGGPHSYKDWVDIADDFY